MNDFTASNGDSISKRNGGLGYNFGDADALDLGVLTGISEDKAVALWEFLLAEDDERLGRWRWPENPDCVVYPMGQNDSGFRFAKALHEPTGHTEHRREGDYRYSPDLPAQQQAVCALEAYFAAHQPWNTAKPGDVWEFTTTRVGRVDLGYPPVQEVKKLYMLTDGGWRTVSRKNTFLDRSAIVSGRPVWSAGD